MDDGRIIKAEDVYERRYTGDIYFNVGDIKYLLELDDTEDEELNYFQSTDFNAGVIYNQIERGIVKHMLGCEGRVSYSTILSMPIIQLLPKSCGSVKEEEIIGATLKAVTQHFVAVYGNKFHLSFDEYWTKNQYINFSYTIRRKEQYKEMTISEIEKALGYKIKVVGE